MSPVEGDDEIGTKAICEHSDGRIRRTQREVAIPLNKGGDQRPVSVVRRFHLDCSQSSDERRLGVRAKPFLHEVGNLCDDKGGDDKFEIRPR